MIIKKNYQVSFIDKHCLLNSMHHCVWQSQGWRTIRHCRIWQMKHFSPIHLAQPWQSAFSSGQWLHSVMRIWWILKDINILYQCIVDIIKTFSKFSLKKTNLLILYLCINLNFSKAIKQHLNFYSHLIVVTNKACNLK